MSLEISGRELVIAGERPIQETEGRVYQQLEIDSGRFRRVVELGADVDAEAAAPPTRTGSCASSCRSREPEDTTRRVPIERDDG